MFDSNQIHFYNSLTNKVEPFHPIIPNKLSMYVCGPTVYNHMHIGNARPVIFFDTVARFFRYIGFEVTYVSNFTDIDDKIIKKALEENTTEEVISERYIKAYLDACQKINVLPDIIHPRVTQTMPEIIDFIQQLMTKGGAYASGDDVYFSIRKDPKYGILSNQKVDDLETGARIDVNTNKQDPLDFTLWKKTKDFGKKWDSPFGCGRPGWHTECVVMIQNIFHGMIDIHGGGNDLKFPHHENEIAQAEVMYNNTIANYWLHNARVDLHGVKMSKSLGNVIWLKDIIEKFPPQAFRLLVLSNHYRQTINYDESLIVQTTQEWQKLDKTYLSLYRYLEVNDIPFTKETLPMMDDFLGYFADDFNTSNALMVLYQLVKNINKDLRNPMVNKEDLAKEMATLDGMFSIFGLDSKVKPLSEDEKTLVQNWNAARKNKDYDLADKLRNEIQEKGIRLS
jgi:cysteinyl-tRNA synthetase